MANSSRSNNHERTITEEEMVGADGLEPPTLSV